MLSFYRFVEIDQPEAFAKMLQVRCGGARDWDLGSVGVPENAPIFFFFF